MSSQFEAIEISSGEFKETVHVPIKNLKGILAPKNDIFSSNKDPEKLIINAIEEPIASKPLELLLNKDSKVSIVVDDATRQTPTQLILKILLKKLEKIGINPENVVIQIANGLHRLTTLEEKKKILGEDVLEKFEVFDNDAKKDEYQFFGETSRGTPLYFNKRVVSADLIITIGMIKSHSFAGFTGGAKSIVPGISNKTTILSNHCFEFIEYPNGILGDADRSIVRKDMEEAARKLPIFIINTVLDTKGHIVDVVAGDVIKAHRKGVEIFKKMAEVYLEEPVDLVIIEGGYPGSINFYQALFGCNVVLTTPKPVLKEKGEIILYAQCKEGIGSNIIEELFDKYKKPTEVLEHLKNNPPLPEQWAAQFLASFLLRAHLSIVTSDTVKRKLQRLGITCFDSVHEAVNHRISKNENVKIVVIKNPDFLIPSLK